MLHTALRRPKTDSLEFNGNDVVKDVHTVLDQIKTFSDKVRDGTITGFTGKNLKNIVAIGIEVVSLDRSLSSRLSDKMQPARQHL